MLRVLVVDDSPVARDLLVEILGNDPEIEIVGTAHDGAEAVERVAELRPDVITMDVQMPRMDGYAATREIMSHRPTPIVIVSGSGNRPDVEKSIASLEAGALTVIGKPPAPQSPRFAIEAARLVATVKAMAGVKVVRLHALRVPVSRSSSATRTGKTGGPISGWDGGRPAGLIAIAASTGGPQVVQTILASLPAAFPIPIVIVQHIAAGFTEGLASWLDGGVALDVRVAASGDRLLPGRVYLAAEGSHLGIGPRGRAELFDRPPVAGFRPSGTVLFESAARVLGRDVVAVVLTGMGSDGVDGLRAVRKCGGRVIAQSPATCVVDGMPSAAIEAGVVDCTLAPAEIGPALATLNALAPAGGVP